MRYNSKLKKLSFLVLSFALMTSLISCDRVTPAPDPTGFEAQDMLGDWYVQFLYEGEDIYGIGTVLITTYNTSENDGTSMWINDFGNTWWFIVNCPINASAMTFSGSSLNSYYPDYGIDVNITNGQITKNGATSPSGKTVDKISFEAEFSDDPGSVYEIVGYRWSGKLTDVPQ